MNYILFIVNLAWTRGQNVDTFFKEMRPRFKCKKNSKNSSK